MESAYLVLERPRAFGEWIPEARFHGEGQALSLVENGREGRDVGHGTRTSLPVVQKWKLKRHHRRRP